jgi:hypothetical protein
MRNVVHCRLKCGGIYWLGVRSNSLRGSRKFVSWPPIPCIHDNAIAPQLVDDPNAVSNFIAQLLQAFCFDL